MIQAFALRNLGAMSFQCHSLEKVFETMHVFLNKEGEKEKKRKKRIGKEKRKERKNGVEKKAFILKANS